MTVGQGVFDLVVFEVLDQLSEHVSRLIRAIELSVLAWLVFKFARLQDFLLNAWVLAFFGSISLKIEIDLVANSVATADATLGGLLSAVLLILLALSLPDFLDTLVSNCEFLFHLLWSGMISLHPGVTNDVSHRKPLMRM